MGLYYIGGKLVLGWTFDVWYVGGCQSTKQLYKLCAQTKSQLHKNSLTLSLKATDVYKTYYVLQNTDLSFLWSVSSYFNYILYCI
jgi:hypothetical protein